MTHYDVEDVKFLGSSDAYMDGSGDLMATFAWTSSIHLDRLKMEHVIPEPDEKSELVEAIFDYNGLGVPVFVSSQYAEQRKFPTLPPTSVKETNPLFSPARL